MVEKLQVYKCGVCGNIVEVLISGGGQPVCCGEPMELLVEKTKDEGFEKHVPVISIKDNKILVKIGSISHPMEKEHYIQWIEIIADGAFYHKFLNPGDKPEAEFCLKADKIIAREHCSVHGLWKS
jgi:superoxide reductase